MTLERDGAEALLVLPSSAFFAERQRIADLTIRHRLPLVAPFREVAEAGGLMAYGPNIVELWGQRVPVYVDRILRGARPGDLPIEQPTKYELVDQSQDRQRARPDGAAIVPAPSGPGDRVTPVPAAARAGTTRS